jgi:hypothetical protein
MPNRIGIAPNGVRNVDVKELSQDDFHSREAAFRQRYSDPSGYCMLKNACLYSAMQYTMYMLTTHIALTV